MRDQLMGEVVICAVKLVNIFVDHGILNAELTSKENTTAVYYTYVTSEYKLRWKHFWHDRWNMIKWVLLILFNEK